MPTDTTTDSETDGTDSNVESIDGTNRDTASATNGDSAADDPNTLNDTNDSTGRITTLKETVLTIIRRNNGATAGGDGTAASSSTSEANEINEEIVAEVADVADLSQTEARAVIEQVAQSEEIDGLGTEAVAEQPATEGPSLRTYDADLIAPASLKLSPEEAQTRDVYTKTIYVEGYPEYARPKMFEQLFADSDHVDVDVSIHIGSHDRLDAIGKLQDAIEDLEVRIAQKSDTSDVTIRDTTRRLQAHEDVYEHLTTGQDETFDVGMYIVLRSTTPDRVQEAADEIETKLKTKQLTVKPVDYRQQEGLVSGSPTALDRVNRTKPMLGGAVGAMFPFSSTSLIEPSGILMGYHALTDSPIVMDRFSRSSYNAIVVGEIGAGKSFNTKLNLLRRVARDPETIVIIIDPRGGFDHLVDALNGHRISIDGSCAINPLELEAIPEHVRADMDDWDKYDPFTQARSSAMDMFDTYFAMHSTGADNTYTAERRAVLQFALDLTYVLHGITADPDTHTNPSPTIPDVRAVLGAISRTPEPFIRQANSGMKITPEVVDELPGLDTDASRVTDASAPEQTAVTVLPTIEPPHADRLADEGIETLGDLIEVEAATVARAADVSPSEADEWREQAMTPDAYAAPAASESPGTTDATDTTATDGGVETSSSPAPDKEVFEIPEEELKEWQQHATGLKIALQPFRPGGPLGHLGQPTEIDISGSKVVYLDLEANETDSETSLMTKVLFNAIYERAKTTDKRVVLPIDEAWRLIKNSESLKWLEQGVRFSRHHDLSIQFITQGLDEFYKREDARAIVNNCTVKLLHRLDEITDAQAKSLGLTERERNYILSATAGQSHAGYSQALLMVEDEGKFPLRIEALPEEVPVIDPDAAADLDLAHGG